MKYEMPKAIPSALLLTTIVGLSACSSDDSSSNDTENVPDDNSEDTTMGSFSHKMQSPVLDFSNGTAYWDMETNSIVTDSDEWEIAVRVAGRDYQILVNGGASGSGEAGVGVLQVASAFDVTDPTNTDQVYKYFGDTVSGPLSTPGSYGPFEYSIEGNHKMWPTFATYLVKDSSENMYKFQILGNYGEDGLQPSGNLVVRFGSATAAASTTVLDGSDASAAAKFDLLNGATTTDENWHFAYQRYVGFKLNGGDSGVGGVSACVAHSYTDLYDVNGDAVVDSFKSFDGSNTLADFESVAMTDTSCIEGSTLAVDSIQPQIGSDQWLVADYSTGAPIFSSSSENSNGWVIRSASQENDEYRYARVSVNTLNVDLNAAPVRQVVLDVEEWKKNQ